MSGSEHTTKTFERCIDAILESAAGYYEPRAGDIFSISDLRLEIVHPPELVGDFNNHSIVIRAVYHDIAFLLTGDGEARAEATIFQGGYDVSAHVQKLGHHGSRTSTIVVCTDGHSFEVRPLVLYSSETSCCSRC